ncbi:phenazine biosynthesis protein PhzF [Rhizobium leguminosarum bv. trifolii CB782]|uniref:PhzF family phenazine biosynthesis protein n=1 Tax=Rhizobium hidalgonense TaxID=1538159 RepID=UPI00027CDD90|nr:PhzF family phenazine biosynthesis protein [Rhizobium hidalgonense]AHG46021.1 phenazine biosynthesis protein PhzF [Rhizobium leguminosarum bv. trifolii CB782]EJC75848.1 phenazine biosynthesis protein PhzF family [Rhizobium leguminosarum bv. trifolii WSM2012]EJC76818.1 phenazine biosynthesis protein PhzF family [Rhizobium leguminosarum bv. trifolii WSM2012]MDR9804687.1 PhzF family phenazine biosynthesis protein [Rhizobium hidalgonense]QKK23211.1 PhzF family phenazine biosynthesis protein [Rh
MARSYSVYDVFTDRKLAGNPLAVIFDADDLSDEVMQAITREINLSETVFVQPSSNPAYAAKLRIFTPGRELPFAGHPTVGTAVALAERAHGAATLDLVTVLEENVGPVRCAVRLREGEASFAEFDLPRKSQPAVMPLDKLGMADALSLKVTEIGFENHVPSVWSAGVPFLLIPVHDVGAAQRVEFDPQLWEKIVPFVEGALASAYVYCRGGVNHVAKFHARMFASAMGIVEDPATGSAAAALSGAIHHFDRLTDGHHPIMIEQGVEMGRPSFIHLHIDVDGGTISNARIGGQAVRLASGTLDL